MRIFLLVSAAFFSFFLQRHTTHYPILEVAVDIVRICHFKYSGFFSDSVFSVKY